MPTVKEILEEQRREGFPALSGATIRFSVPLRENVVNAILAADRAKKEGEGKPPGPDIRLTLIDGGIEARNLPVIGSLAFTLPERIDFPADPILRLTPRGLLGRLVGSVIGALGIAPDFVRVESGQVRVDLERWMASKGYGDVLPLLRPINIHSLPGIIWLEGEINIP